MKTALAVARREIVEKRFVLAAAAVAAVIPFVVPIVRRLPVDVARDTRDFVALIFAATISGAAAVGLGASIFAAETAANRMGFFFSRPISPASLWAGKVAGAFALVAAACLGILAPVALVDHDRIAARDAGIGLLLAAGTLLGLLLFANVLSTMIRSRSLVALADLAAFAAIGTAVGVTGRELRRWSFEPPEPVLWIAGVACLSVLLWSSYRAVARGRTDLPAAHGALSAALWAGFGSLAVLFVAYAAWVLAAPPSAIGPDFWSATTVGRDGRVFFSGKARGLHAGFLYDTRSARFERIPAVGIAVSADGRLAAWVERASRRGPWALFALRLDDSEARPAAMPLVFPSQPFPLLLSPDGTSVAALEHGLLTVSELRTGRTLASVRVGETTGWRTGAFLPSGHVRILRSDGATPDQATNLEAIDLDVAARAHTVFRTFDTARGAWSTAFDRGADRLLTRDSLCTRVMVRDSVTLVAVAALREGPRAWCSARWLADGSIALALSDRESSRVEVFTGEGVRRRVIPLGPPGFVRLAGQPAEGSLFVSVSPLPSKKDTGSPPTELLLVDLERGTASPVAQGLRPLAERWWVDPLLPDAPGSAAARLFVSDGGALVRFDPATGERRVLLGRP